jgi:hypothetical protein
MDAAYIFQERTWGFEKVGCRSGHGQCSGWWFSLAAGDFDKDGDTDYVAGNLGLNNRFKPSPEEPVSVYAKDYDGNGSLEPIMTYFLNGEEVTVANRDQITSVMPSIKKKFDTYTKFSEARFETVFSTTERSGAQVMKATTFASVYVENKGNGQFAMRPLPLPCQFAPVQAMQVADVDNDGALDIMMTGNFYSPDFMTGQYDASIGLVVKGDGKGNFTPLTAAQSGIHITGDARSLAAIRVKGKNAVLSGVNKGRLQLFTATK